MRKMLLVIVGLSLIAAGAFGQTLLVAPAGKTLPLAVEQEKPAGPNPNLDWPIVGQIQTYVPSPTGLAYHAGTNLFCVPNWSQGSPEAYIYKINPATGATVSTIPSPSSWPGGITCVGDTLWVTDYLGGMQIFKISFQTGAVYAMYSIPYSAYWAGCAWDGQYVYYGNNTTDLIYKMNPNTGATVGTIPVPMGGGISGLTYYDGHLYYSENDGDMLYKITMAGVIVDSSPAPTGWPSGLTVVDGDLWNVENYSHVIYKFDLGGMQVTVTLTPVNPPIIILPSGGTFEFNILIHNSESLPVWFDAWTALTFPSPPGGGIDPLIGPRALSLIGGNSISRDLSMYVPGNAWCGVYTYHAYVGDYPDVIWDSDSFTFEKIMPDNGASPIGDWRCEGDFFGEPLEAAKPAEFAVLGNYPNPFNPSTTISFALPEASEVSLRIYDLCGRQVATLLDGWREAGSHEVVFDGSNLASGVYIYRMQAGNHSASSKMVLMK